MFAPDATATAAPRRAPPRARRALEPGERERAGGLEHRAGVLEGVLDGGADLVDAHGEAVVEVALAEGEGELARLLRRDAVGEEADVLAAHARPCRSDSVMASESSGSHADDAHRGPQLLHHRRDARPRARRRRPGRRSRPGRAAPGAGSRGRPCPGPRSRRGGRTAGSTRHPGVAREDRAVRRGVGVVVADELDRRAQPAHRLHLDGGRGARHHDAAAQPEPRGRGGHALRVVARPTRRSRRRARCGVVERRDRRCRRRAA